MKNLLKLLAIFLMLFTIASCQKDTSRTCVCTEPASDLEISRTDLSHLTENEAKNECSENAASLNARIEVIEAVICELE